MKKRLLSLILLGIGLFLFYSMISRVGFEEILTVLKRASFIICLAGIVFYSFSLAIRAQRWLILSRQFKNNLHYKDILPFYASNLLMGSFTPLKVGEAATPFLLKKYFKIPVGQGFSLVFIDRFSDLLCFLLLLVWAAIYTNSRGIHSNPVSQVIFAMFVLLSVLLIFLICLIVFQKISLKIVSRLASLKFLNKYAAYIRKELIFLYEGVALVKENKIYIKIFLLTMLSWFIEVGSFYLFFTSILRPYFFDVAASQILSIGAGLVAFIPGGLGVAEISSSSLLKLMGYPLFEVAAVVILIRVLTTGLAVLYGIAGFYFMKEKVIANTE